jgi:hypothetical protein
MPLTSPRFAPNRTLQKAAANSPPLAKGTSGLAVHLVQMALLDLGYSMPISTGGIYSPDGIFGDETARVVTQFQKASKLKDDGVVGQKTMEELDRRFPRNTHRVRLHFRSIALTNVPFNQIMTDTETVYGQYGIKAEFASGESLLLSAADMTLFDRIDQDCKWELKDGEFHDLQGRGSPAPSTEVLVFYVSKLKNNLTGCGGHAKQRPACTVAGSASRWSTAHELGHVLLGSGFTPVHVSEDKRNLMFPTAQFTATSRVLTDKQVKQMRNSDCCRAIP